MSKATTAQKPPRAAATAKKNAKTTAAPAQRAKTTAAVATPANSAVKTEGQKLQTLNLLLAFLFVVQAVAIPLYGAHKVAPVTTQYLTADTLQSQVAGHPVLVAATRHLYDKPLIWTVAVSLGVMALVHLLVATRLRSRYEAQQRQGINVFFWSGFGLSAGITIAVIALLSGISNVATLLAIFVATIAGSLLVPAAQIVDNERKGKGFLPHMVCAMPLVFTLLPWVMIGVSVWGALQFGGTIPGALWTIYASMFGLYLILLGVTHFRMSLKGKLRNMPTAERVYMLLGLVTTSALAWQVFAESFIK
ncbi:MAG TPA: heliorhodopsin HeR [Candidatus Saccharimonadales bacterium]|nr:heliorhodopsin HeR [Candidatus Saccharimonadales bacterium]